MVILTSPDHTEPRGFSAEIVDRNALGQQDNLSAFQHGLRQVAMNPTRYGNGPLDAFDADADETILGHLIYERGILIDHALQALRPVLVSKLRSTKASATWSIRMGGAGMVGGLLLGTVAGPLGLLPALAGAAIMGMGVQARSHLPRREAEAAIVLRHPQVLDQIKALALQGISPLQLVAAWDQLLDHIVDLGPVQYRTLGSDLIGSEFARLAQTKSAPLLCQAEPRRSPRPIAPINKNTPHPVASINQGFDDDDDDGDDDQHWGQEQFENDFWDDDEADDDEADEFDDDYDTDAVGGDFYDLPEPAIDTIARPAVEGSGDLWDDEPDDDLSLWARLDADCPQLLRLIDCGPLRVIGPNGSGKSELLAVLLGLRWKYAHHLVERPLAFGAELSPVETWIAAGAECATRVRRQPADRTTYVWDHFLDLESFTDDTDARSLKSSLNMILRHSQAIDTHHVFICLTDDQCHNPIAGSAQLFRRSTVKVEAIGASVQGPDGLYKTAPSGEYKVTWIDGVVERFVLPDLPCNSFSQ